MINPSGRLRDTQRNATAIESPVMTSLGRLGRVQEFGVENTAHRSCTSAAG
jgi:hypothetical protein